MTTNRRIHSNLLVAAFLGAGVLLVSSASSAQECASNDQCPAGFECMKGMFSPGCANPPDCPDPTPVESEFGSCEPAPVTCASDADCPSYLKCVASDASVCWADSSGDSGCSEPDPNAAKYCAYAPIDCASNQDCPADFECIEGPTACTAMDCPEGAECPEPVCGEPETQCVPRTIECEATTDCPTDWLCMETGGADCATAPSTPDGAEPADREECVSIPVDKRCVPPGFTGASYDDALSAAGGGEQTAAPRGGSTPASEDDSGCSISNSKAGATGFGAMMAIAALALIGRRRRA